MINMKKCLMILGVLLLIASSGCVSKKGKTGAASGDIDTIEVFGSDGYPEDFDAANLPPRPGDDVTYAEGQSQFEPVIFAYDSSQISPAERFKIESVSEYLQQNGDVGVIIEGHCDERGSREYNLALGERRALAVRAYLIALGVDGNRVQTKSYGEENPIAFGHDADSWGLNRRGEFVIFY